MTSTMLCTEASQVGHTKQNIQVHALYSSGLGYTKLHPSLHLTILTIQFPRVIAAAEEVSVQ